jgi:hypothetical protein
MTPGLPYFLMAFGFFAFLFPFLALLLRGENDWLQTFQSDFTMIFKYVKPS